MENLKTLIDAGLEGWIKEKLQRLSVNCPAVEDYYFAEYPAQKEFDCTWKKAAYLFFAQELPPCCKRPEDVQTCWKTINAKSKENHRANCMPQINTEHWQEAPDKQGYCLYAGSSNNNIKSRMKHHFELSGTYGLHLDAWWPRENKPLAIHVLKFGETVSAEYLSLIEDTLWEHYKPLFGKKGPR
jgi:hypothetical protein